jgi:hypothetical protein
MKGNAINVIRPYMVDNCGIWIFDDPERGICREPFIGETNTIISTLCADIPDAGKGFSLLFSSQWFPGAIHKFEKVEGDEFGTTYSNAQMELEGWLCPALFKYFEKAPEVLFVAVQP